jgi:UDP-N-acetylmuramoyl-tripeptide--D-alanyl-D-alanine ligase
VVILELGMNAPGEIKRLCEIGVPSHGIITNIGLAHIGGLGSFDSIRSAKLEILQGLTVAVLNADDSFLMEGYKSVIMQGGFDGRVIAFSINPIRRLKSDLLSNGVNIDFHVRAENVFATDNGSSFTLGLEDGESVAITLNIHGLFNVYNALAASAVCLSLGIAIEEIKTALEGYTAFPMRFEVIRGDKITLINDSYNANPSSIEESLKELVRIRGKGRTVAILGDMFELGRFSERAHRAIGKMISNIGVNVFVAVGEMMSLAAEESQSESTRTEKVRNQKLKNELQLTTFDFKSVDEVKQNISDIIKEGDVVLIKGSRVMGMEKIVERIRE